MKIAADPFTSTKLVITKTFAVIDKRLKLWQQFDEASKQVHHYSVILNSQDGAWGTRFTRYALPNSNIATIWTHIFDLKKQPTQRHVPRYFGLHAQKIQKF